MHMLSSEHERPAVQLANARPTVLVELAHAFFAGPANDRNRFRVPQLSLLQTHSPPITRVLSDWCLSVIRSVRPLFLSPLKRAWKDSKTLQKLKR